MALTAEDFGSKFIVCSKKDNYLCISKIKKRKEYILVIKN